MIHLSKPAKGSRLHSRLPLPLRAPLDLLDDTPQVTEKLAWQPVPVVEPSFVLGPHHNYQLFELLGRWARVAHAHEEYIASKIRRPQQALRLFL